MYIPECIYVYVYKDIYINFYKYLAHEQKVQVRKLGAREREGKSAKIYGQKKSAKAQARRGPPRSEKAHARRPKKRLLSSVLELSIFVIDALCVQYWKAPGETVISWITFLCCGSVHEGCSLRQLGEARHVFLLQQVASSI
jgi:hypothetical protein